MMYLYLQSVSDSTHMGIGCFSRTCKASPTTPLDYEGAQDAVGNLLLYLDAYVYPTTPLTSKGAK